MTPPTIPSSSYSSVGFIGALVGSMAGGTLSSNVGAHRWPAARGGASGSDCCVICLLSRDRATVYSVLARVLQESAAVTIHLTYRHFTRRPRVGGGLKIKRIEICGFKSFVDKTTISFPDPITSIVGPNGCGKSNIVDAIRWVMGEQSAKHLRGRAMEDVIFAGSESRGPAGMAEVSLTFDSSGLDQGVAPGGVPWGAAAPEEIVGDPPSLPRRQQRVPARTACRRGCATSSSSSSAPASARRRTRSSSRAASASSCRRGRRIAAASSTRRPASPATSRRRRRPSAAWTRRASTCCASPTSSARSKAGCGRCGCRRRRPSATSATRASSRTSICGRRRSATSDTWRRRSRWAPSWRACARVTRPRAPRWRRERPPPTPTAWP